MKKFIENLIPSLILLILLLPLVVLAGDGDKTVPLSPGASPSTDLNSYTLLAPIPGLGTTVQTNSIGDYFNKIFLVAIGLCGVLAVIMIVIGGVQYMGTESVFGKTEAKGRIFAAILGLFIALGAYALLYTINPDLTGQNGLTIDQVSVDIDQDVAESSPVPLTSNQINQIMSTASDNKFNVEVGKTSGSGVLTDNWIVNKITNVVEKPGLQDVKAIVIHGTEGYRAQDSLYTWIDHNTDTPSKALCGKNHTDNGSATCNDNGAHFIIDRDGSVWQVVRINMRANHFSYTHLNQVSLTPVDITPVKAPAGFSNSNTLGIEMVLRADKNNNWQTLTQPQKDSLVKLIKRLQSIFPNITKSDIYCHRQLDDRPGEGVEAVNYLRSAL